MKKIVYILFIFLFACSSDQGSDSKHSGDIKEKIFTQYSSSPNEYPHFNSVKAINRIADIENEYFQTFEDSVSRYYGTVWRENAEKTIREDSTSQYENYLSSLNHRRPDSLHCTLYAYEGLKAGLTEEQLTKLESLHKDIWKTREIAGWSIGYILVKNFDWKAYLFLNPKSKEYARCMKSFQKNKNYNVWRQPDIPLEEIFIIGEEDSLINSLLMQHEFGWGFSEQGIHTWITRYEDLKECNWLGAPSRKYSENPYEKPLFIKTPFEDYVDYNSHVLVVPTKKRTLSEN